MPVAFEARAREGLSRTGELETPHGTVRTPALMPVVNPNRVVVEPERMRAEFGTQVVITNAYIVNQHDELRERAREEGVHELVGWDGPLVTDSGTFQDYVYGDVNLEPAEIVELQREIGTDVGTILDLFSPPGTPREEALEDVEGTRERALEAVELAGEMALNLPVQGARFPELRRRAARELADVSPPGGAVHPIGGVVPLLEQRRYRELVEVVLGAQRGLHAGRAVHLFGAGHPHMLALAVYLGCDLFDSAAYAKYAADDRLLFAWGTEHLDALTELPCACPACREHGLEGLEALAGDERARALAEHNLHATHAEMRRIRSAQASGRLFELVLERLGAHPEMAQARRGLVEGADQLEAREPLSHHRAVTVLDRARDVHPQRVRARRRVRERLSPRGPLVLLEATTRPFTANARETVRELRARGVHPFFPSRLGPVPFDVDEAYPFSQCREPPLGEATRRECEAELADLARAWGIEVLDADQAREREPGREVDLGVERVQATARYQFGPGADALLAGELDVEVSPRTGRVRTVEADGEHVVSRRPHDGLFTLKLAGGRRLHQGGGQPAPRVRVDAESAPFNADGKSVFAAFVVDCPDRLRPGEECLVVGPGDRLAAVGRLRVSPPEARDLESGPVVDVREGVGRERFED